MINSLIGLLFCLAISNLVNCELVDVFDEKQLGYYAFEKATRNELPPRVRTPPYHQLNIQCPGLTNNDKYMENKDTLCGDLNRGYVPLSPMNIIIQNQHYPFELIKNKTLHFLARTLPYLKEDHENIPKVFKIGQTTNHNELYQNSDSNPSWNSEAINYRSKRQVGKATITKIEKSELNETTLPKGNVDQSSHSMKKSKNVDGDFSMQQESRQKGCEQNDGILCHIMQAITANAKSNGDSGSLFGTISQTYQMYKVAQNANNFLQMLTGSIDKSDNGNNGNEKTANDQYSNRPIISQVLSAFNSMNNNQSPTTTSAPSSNNANSYGNPLGAFFDYFSKKRPVNEYEEYMNGLTAASSSVQPTIAKTDDQIQLAQPTPTACPSIEEYVTPVYARNYQGVWKYVVQIPHEGYFTQTLQKTSCVKNKCDYMDGMCKEASRWVSLLVAEVYYPNTKQPLNNMLPQSSQLKPTIYNSLNGMQNVNELNSKLNAQNLPSSPAFSNEQILANYELLNSLVPTNYNEYNHYDQTFARRASKLHQPTNQPINQKMTIASYPTNAATLSTAASYSIPQYQDFTQNQEFNPNIQYQASALQPNYNQQIVNNQQYGTSASTKQVQPLTQSLSQSLSQAQAKAQFQQLIDLYQQQIIKQQQQQYLTQQLAKSKLSTNNAGFNLIDSLSSAASMNYPTVVAGLSNQAIQPQNNIKQLNDPKQNEVKPRSFDTMNNPNILESTLMKSSYINNNEETSVGSNNDKMISNDRNTNKPTDNQVTSTTTSEQNENSSKENNEECDGYDNNGCYIIRVYYDWFLVNGSCKCWKPNAKSGSLETLKKIFIGK